MSTSRLKFFTDKEKNKAYHGDVLIKLVCNIPEGASEEAAPEVLGWGEVAGAAHRITEGEFKFYKHDTMKYLKAYTELLIKHDVDGHKPLILPPGDYIYGNASEFDYEEMEARRVAD